MSAELDTRVERALAGERFALARLVSYVEDGRAQADERRRQVMAALAARTEASAVTVGITGPPGAGKSSLIAALCRSMHAADPAHRIAVVAVDPSSAVSGGSLLGDRTRMAGPDAGRVYFRSQAADRELGGVSRATWPVCRLLAHLFDTIFVETVGIGQSEVEVQHVADHVLLVLPPLGGDQVQFMKAGIMEIPHLIALNKCDERRAAARSLHALRASIDFARPGAAEQIEIVRTSASTGEGVDALAKHVLALPRHADAERMAGREAHFFDRWVRDEYGRTGLRDLRSDAGGAEVWVRDHGSYEAAQAAWRARATA